MFGIMQLFLSQLPDIDRIWLLSALATVMSFTYSGIGLGLCIAKDTRACARGSPPLPVPTRPQGRHRDARVAGGGVQEHALAQCGLCSQSRAAHSGALQCPVVPQLGGRCMSLLARRAWSGVWHGHCRRHPHRLCDHHACAEGVRHLPGRCLRREARPGAGESSREVCCRC